MTIEALIVLCLTYCEPRWQYDDLYDRRRTSRSLDESGIVKAGERRTRISEESTDD